MPPVYGMYSALIPVLVYVFLGTSPHLSIGPVAVTSILLMAGVSDLAVPFSESFVELVLLTGFLVGVVQVLMGLFKLGFFVNVLAQPVISGFISAAAIIIIVSQLKSGLGVEIPSGFSTLDSIWYLVTHLSSVHIFTFLLTLGCVLALFLFKRINKNFPTALFLIVVFTALSYFFNFELYGITILGEISKGLPRFYVPQFNWETIKTLFPTVFTITIIGYLGSIGIAKSFQMKHRDYEVDPNKELIALGFAKVLGTFFQGNLASGSYSRSAINEDAGAKTNLAALAVVVIILFSLLFLTPLLYYLPKPVLAAIILVSVFSLVKVKQAKRFLKIKLDDFVIMLITFFVTLFVTIEAGVLAGVLLSFVFLQYRSSKPHIAELVKIPNTNYYRNINRFPEGEENEVYLIIRLDDQLYFANSDYFKEVVYRLLEKRKKSPKYIILHANNIHNIDSSGLYTLENLYWDLKNKDIEILFSGMIGPVRDILTRSGFMEIMTNDHQFMNIDDAIHYIKHSSAEKLNFSKNHVFQFNERKFNLRKKIARIFFKKS